MIFASLIEELPKRGEPPRTQDEWSVYPFDHLHNKHKRMSWSGFCRMPSKLGEIYTDEELADFKL
jgi:hypothetical protein